MKFLGRALLALLTGACLLLAGCAPKPEAPAGSGEAVAGQTRSVAVTIDGAPWDGSPLAMDEGEPLRVYIFVDEAQLMELPFGQARTVQITQPDGAQNTVAITEDAVYMYDANCDNLDCVNMGRVTRDNLEMRVMGGFIICLPHRVTVEVRGD